MKKSNIVKRLLCLGLTALMALSLASCGGKAVEQNSAPPTNSTPSANSLQTTNSRQSNIQPAEEVPPTPTPAIPFTDVPEDSRYYDAVKWAYENGIVSDGSAFEPDSVCTRGQVVTFMWRAMGSPEPWIMKNPISDISPSAWYYKPALWAYQNNIATGTAFHSGNACTNGEALTFLWRAKGKPIVLVASDKYYARPVAWADQNGLFAGLDSAFDPAAPCSRADFLTYLFWAKNQWTPTEEERTIQAEYEKILYTWDYATEYADYVDVDGDGSVELLMLTSGYERYGRVVTMTVYANMNGHVGKLCEGTGQFDEGTFSICIRDGQLYLNQSYSIGREKINDIYKIENGAFVTAAQIVRELEYSEDPDAGDMYSYWISTEDITALTEEEYRAELTKYAGKKEIFTISYEGISVKERGILPSEDECERYWTAYWKASDSMYAAVLSGDFSAFAGTYEPASDYLLVDSLVLKSNGAVSVDDPYFSTVTGQEPISVTVSEDGAIHGVLQLREGVDYDGYVWHSSEYYIIYPVGVSDPGDPNNPDYQSDPAKVRMEYWHPSDGVDVDIFTKIS